MVVRVECATHGVKQLRVPWAEPGSQFTALFERLAIDLLRECSVTGAVGLLRISWDEGCGIRARAISRLRHVLNRAVAWSYLRDSPARGIVCPKAAPGRVRYLEQHERDALLRHASQASLPRPLDPESFVLGRRESLSVSRAFKRLVQQLKLSSLTFHDLWHDVASTMTMAGVPQGHHGDPRPS